MKNALKISIILNLALFAVVVIIWATGRMPFVPSASPVRAKVEPAGQSLAAAAKPVMQQAEPQFFHWSQLESADYRTYVRNLRQIGCPAGTLRAIVTADVDVVFRKRSQELQQRLADLNNDSWTNQFNALPVEQTLKSELAALPDQESAEIADLLGLKIDSGQQTVLSAQDNENSATAPVVMPLVFRPVDLSGLDLNKEELQTIANLRQEFWDEIGGPNQDPNDPAYRERWQKAQPEIDSMLKGELGYSFYENYRIATENP